MNAIKLAWLEVRRFRGPWRPFALLVLVLVPLAFAGVYLWANWDPYGRLDRVPVAVVNADQPVISNGERIDTGSQFVQQIKGTDLFDWEITNATTARRGLVQGRFSFAVEVPPDFSAKLATASHSNPQRATLKITKNDANGYLAGIMADTVRSELQNQINAAAHTAYARALYGELDDARERLQLASQGSKHLTEGTKLSEQSIAALTGRLNSARNDAGRLDRDAQQVANATTRLNRQLAAIGEFSADQLPRAVNALVKASNITVDSLTSIRAGSSFVRNSAAENAAAVEGLRHAHPNLAADPAYQRALNSAHQLTKATAHVDENARGALSSAQDASNRATALQSSMGPLQDHIRSLIAPAAALRSSTTELAAVSQEINSDLTALAGGNGVLHSSTGKLNDGAKRLNHLVDDGLDKIPPTDPTQVAQAADVLSSPAEIQTTNLNPAGVYGRGLAPLFVAIALWVFGVIAYLLLNPVNTRALASQISAFSIALAGWLPAAILGVAGGLVLFTVLHFGLGLAPVHLLWTIGLIALGALAFVSIDHFLRTALGAFGGLLSLVLLLLQLTASGGLYPLETAPQPFQVLSPFLPMTYLINGLRVTISGGLAEHLARDAAVLGGFLMLCLLLTTLTVLRRRFWTLGRLRPEVEL